MGTLDLKRETTTVTLPKTKGKVEIYKSFTYEDHLDFLEASSDIKDPAWPILMVSVKSWDFKDHEGKDIPFSQDTLKKLPLEDVGYLLEEIAKLGKKGGFLGIKKKQSS